MYILLQNVRNLSPKTNLEVFAMLATSIYQDQGILTKKLYTIILRGQKNYNKTNEVT